MNRQMNMNEAQMQQRIEELEERLMDELKERLNSDTMDEGQQEDTDALKVRASHPKIADFIQSMAEWGFNYHDHTLLWDAMCLVVEADEKGDFEDIKTEWEASE